MVTTIPKAKTGFKGLYDEIIVPDERYFDALGKFVHEFSRAEATTYGVLRYYAKLSNPVAAALLSGIRANDIISSLRRLCEAGAISEATWLVLQPLFNQFNAINTARNMILHFGAMTTAGGERYVTTGLKAVREEDAKTMPISKDILDDMRLDLRKIIVHLRLNHRGLPPPRAKHPSLDAIVSAPWRYKPPQEPRGKAKKIKSLGSATRHIA